MFIKGVDVIAQWIRMDEFMIFHTAELMIGPRRGEKMERNETRSFWHNIVQQIQLLEGGSTAQPDVNHLGQFCALLLWRSSS